jgi:predicted RNA-binding Zn-ribbon protein involved in translation (DUF1610 family)
MPTAPRHGDSRSRVCDCGYALSGLPKDDSGRFRCPECGVRTFGRAPGSVVWVNALLGAAVITPCVCLLTSTLLRDHDKYGFPLDSWIDVAIIASGWMVQCAAWFNWFGRTRMNTLSRIVFSPLSAVATTAAGCVFVFSFLVARVLWGISF